MPGSARHRPLDLLRTWITLLVVAHHAVLAYHPFAFRPRTALSATNLIWTAFPVVDTARWPGIELFVGFNDSFFMALMFLIAGVFTARSLALKGSTRFLRDRVLRLGLPFLAGAGLLAPLAYYPSYLQGASGAPTETFWGRWMDLGVWPAGPAWFLWVLLAFSALAALLPRPGARLARLLQRPSAAFGALVLVSAAAYLPMAAAFTPDRWVSWGPFFVQIGRLLHYAVYFGAGLALGAAGLDTGLLDPQGPLARRWALWALGAVACFLLSLGTFLAVVSSFTKGGPGPALATFGNFTYVLTCAAISFAALALALRFARREGRVMDALRPLAFGIYLLHYPLASWLQLALLDLPLSGAAKALLTTFGAVALSAALTAALRRIPVLTRAL